MDSSLKLHYSFPISLLLHGLVVGVLAFSFANESFEGQFTIGGISGGNSGSEGRKALQVSYTGIRPQQVAPVKKEKPKLVPKAPKKEEVTPVKELENTAVAVDGSGVGDGQGSGVGSGSGVHEFEQAVVNFREPVYPRQAIRRGIEGILKVRIKVDNEGLPQQVELVKSSGHSILDQSALDAIPSWRFKKTMAFSSSEYYWVEKTIAFQIKESM